MKVERFFFANWALFCESAEPIEMKEPCMYTYIYHYSSECFITACKRSLGQGNVFTHVCHPVHGGSLYDVTSCLTARSYVPSGGSLSRDISVRKPPGIVNSGQYASYWNAFLFEKIIFQLLLTLVALYSFWQTLSGVIFFKNLTSDKICIGSCLLPLTLCSYHKVEITW